MKVSIIVPVYNVEKYIRRCIQSLIAQTYKNIEIILIDDGSSDKSGVICEEYKKKYFNININVIHQKNRGLASARNVGIHAATGDLIGFVDSDDYVREDFVQVLVDPILIYDVDISISGWYVVRNKEIQSCHFKHDEQVINNDEAINILLSYHGFDNFAVNKLYKKKLFSKIVFPEGEILEDLATIYKLLKEAEKVHISDIPLYYYEIHDSSITSDLYRQIEPRTFNIYIERREKLLMWFPHLKTRINENYFLACRLNFKIAIKSRNRFLKFERFLIKEMRKNLGFVLKDKEINFRMFIGSVLICILPYWYGKK